MGKLIKLDKYRDNVLHTDHIKGRVFVPMDPPKIDLPQEAFEERMARIKSSLEKINKLMADLKKSRVDNGDT